jgi:hypothetical protein
MDVMKANKVIKSGRATPMQRWDAHFYLADQALTDKENGRCICGLGCTQKARNSLEDGIMAVAKKLVHLRETAPDEDTYNMVSELIFDWVEENEEFNIPFENVLDGKVKAYLIDAASAYYDDLDEKLIEDLWKADQARKDKAIEKAKEAQRARKEALPYSSAERCAECDTPSCTIRKAPYKGLEVAEPYLSVRIERWGRTVVFQVLKQVGIKEGTEYTAINGFRIASIVCPTISNNKVFLRGDSKGSDWNVTTYPCGKGETAEYIKRLVEALKEYTSKSGIKLEIQGDAEYVIFPG